jgi:hypothetical protein
MQRFAIFGSFVAHDLGIVARSGLEPMKTNEISGYSWRAAGAAQIDLLEKWRVIMAITVGDQLGE